MSRILVLDQPLESLCMTLGKSFSPLWVLSYLISKMKQLFEISSISHELKFINICPFFF